MTDEANDFGRLLACLHWADRQIREHYPPLSQEEADRIAAAWKAKYTVEPTFSDKLLSWLSGDGWK